MTGLSVDTLRAWERRYEAVVPERSGRGRQYRHDQIERLQLLRQLVQQGHAIGQVASLSDDELRGVLSRRLGNGTPAPSPALSGILSAIEDFQASRAADEMGRLATLLSPRDLVYQVALPLMSEVGVRWHQGKLSVAQEHLTSQILRSLLGNLIRLSCPSRSPVKMVIATPVGEWHEFGALAAAMLASTIGIEPIYLGPNVPAKEIAETARRTEAHLIVLAITIPTVTSLDEVRATAAAMPAFSQLWVGGETGASLDIGAIPRAKVVADLPAFETACHQWSHA